MENKNITKEIQTLVQEAKSRKKKRFYGIIFLVLVLISGLILIVNSDLSSAITAPVFLVSLILMKFLYREPEREELIEKLSKLFPGTRLNGEIISAISKRKFNESEMEFIRLYFYDYDDISSSLRKAHLSLHKTKKRSV